MKIKGNIFDLLWLIIPVVLVSLGNVVSKNLECTGVDVKLRESEQNNFLSEERVLEEVESELTYTLEGGKLIHNDLNEVELLLKTNKFVKTAEVVSDHTGKVVFNIVQERPMARVITNDSSYYLTESGTIMPTSYHFTSRVMIVLGTEANNLLRLDSLTDVEQRNKFVEMIRYIKDDPFLKAQIATVEVKKNKKILLYPQVTHQVVEFGKCVNYVEKLDKLKIFYKQVLPRKGWTAYSKVNLQYKDQIICE